MVKGEFYTEKRNTSTANYDRYKNCSIIEDIETGDIYLSTRENLEMYSSQEVKVITMSQDYSSAKEASLGSDYHRVQTNETTRLDILAHEYYKNPLLWWVIAQANNIYDPFVEIPSGSLLRIPTLIELYGNNGILL